MPVLIFASAFLFGYLTIVIVSGRWYVPDWKFTIFRITGKNWVLWGDKTTNPVRLLDKFTSRVTAILLLLVPTIYLYAYSSSDNYNYLNFYNIIALLLGIGVGVKRYIFDRQESHKQEEKQQKANPIRIRRDY